MKPARADFEAGSASKSLERLAESKMVVVVVLLVVNCFFYCTSDPEDERG